MYTIHAATYTLYDIYRCILRFHYIRYQYNTAFTESFMFGLHGWISGVCWINRGWRSNTAIITCTLRGKRHFLRKPEKPLKIKNKFKTCSIPDIKSLVNKNSVFFLFCPMDIFIPSLLTKNNLRQLLLRAGKRSFLRDHEVVVSNGWLLYSGFHSYLLNGGVKLGGCLPTREAKKPKTHCVKRDKSTKAYFG